MDRWKVEVSEQVYVFKILAKFITECSYLTLQLYNPFLILQLEQNTEGHVSMEHGFYLVVKYV